MTNRNVHISFRRFFAFFLTLTMILSSLSLSAFADSDHAEAPSASNAFGTVTFSIETRTIDGKDLVSPVEVALQENDTVHTLLQRVADEKNIPVENNTGTYVTKIGNFSNGCFNNNSGGYASDGWTVAVNGNIGEYPFKIPASGDIVRWQFSVAELGKDTLISDEILKLRQEIVKAEEIVAKPSNLQETLATAKDKLAEIDAFVEDPTWNTPEAGCPEGVTPPNYWAYFMHCGNALTGDFSNSDTSELTQIMRMNKALSDALSNKIVATEITFSAVGNPSEFLVGSSYDFNATINPADATDQTVTWNLVEASGSGTIDKDGIFRPSKAGTVIIQAFHEDINLGKTFAAKQLITIPGPKFDSLLVQIGSETPIDLAGKTSITVNAPSNANSLFVTPSAMDSVLTYKYKKFGDKSWTNGTLKNNEMHTIPNCLAYGASGNLFRFTVKKDGASTEYSLTVKKTNPADLTRQSTALINTIADTVSASGILSQNISYGSDFTIGLYAANKGSFINAMDKENFLAKVLAEARNSETSIGTLAKNTIALTAMGIDPTKIPSNSSNSGIKINLLDGLSKPQYVPYGGLYSAPYVLMAYSLGYGENTTEEAIKADIISYFHTQQKDATYWAPDAWGTPATDKVALIATALAPYYSSNNEAKETIDNTLAWLKTQQNSKSGFGNTNSDATVILALTPLMSEENLKPHILSLLEGALSEMLTFQLPDKSGFDYMDNKYFNAYATMQGLQALAAYTQYTATSPGSGNIFMFDKTQVKEYQNWPEKKFPLEIFVKPPTKTTYALNEYLDTSGMEVTAKFSDNSTEQIPLNLCTVGWLDTSSSGTKTVAVDYLGKTASFTAIVTSSGGGGPSPEVKEVFISVEKTPISREKIVVNPRTTSVLDVLKTATSNHNISMSSHRGYVTEINGIEEFAQGPNSGWLYKVNDTTPPTTASDTYKLFGGESINWYYSTDYTQDSSASGWGNATPTEKGTSSETTATVIVKANAKTDSKGNATVSISSKDISEAIVEVKKLATSNKTAKKMEVKIHISVDEKATSLEVLLPKSALSALAKTIDFLTISSNLSALTFDKEAVKNIEKTAGSEIKFQTAKSTVKERPVYDVSLQSGDVTITELGGQATISIPYTPAKGENENALVIYFIEKDGKETLIQNGYYHAKAKAMQFETDHFSQYKIGYNPVTFTDITGHWAADSIQYLASRNIVSGKQGKQFKPNDTITRAEFVTILANKCGADFSTYSTSQFNDVKKDQWYYGAVSWAAEQGIVKGVEKADGSLVFNPNGNITREDMAVILNTFETKIEKTALPEKNKAITFSDASKMFPYAKESITTMQKAGIINGIKSSDGTYYFNPKGSATRGEASKMIASLMTL